MLAPLISHCRLTQTPAVLMPRPTQRGEVETDSFLTGVLGGAALFSGMLAWMKGEEAGRFRMMAVQFREFARDAPETTTGTTFERQAEAASRCAQSADSTHDLFVVITLLLVAAATTAFSGAKKQ